MEATQLCRETAVPERNYQDIAKGWAAWLTRNLGQMRQVDLVQSSGGALKPALVSRWMRGDHAPSAENAIVVAKILGTDPVETLRAAGHDAMADLVAMRQAGPTEKDPIVRRIQDHEALTAEEKAQLVAAYWRRSEDVRKDFARQLAMATDIRLRAVAEAEKRGPGSE
jgi:hypothetical protein